MKTELQELLKNNVMNVKFIKNDGTIREMKCTLIADYLPAKLLTEDASEVQKTRIVPPDQVVVWDVDKNDWRSFRADSVVSVERAGS